MDPPASKLVSSPNRRTGTGEYVARSAKPAPAIGRTPSEATAAPPRAKRGGGLLGEDDRVLGIRPGWADGGRASGAIGADGSDDGGPSDAGGGASGDSPRGRAAMIIASTSAAGSATAWQLCP